MTDRDFTQPSEHEKRVLEERAEESGIDSPEEMTGEAPAEVGTTSYEAEVEAERRGTTADEVASEAGEDERTPLDSGFRPRSG